MRYRKVFADFIKKLEGVQITLSSDGKKMDIIYADSQTSMQVLSADDFPKIDLEIKENSFKIKTKDLKTSSAQRLFAALPTIPVLS